MGEIINGQWITDEDVKATQTAAYERTSGKFERSKTVFRNWVTEDGSAGSSGSSGFKAEAGRYHLFAALNCPWAHRTLIYRNIKNLGETISLSLASPIRTDQGWVFESNDKRFADELYDLSAVHEIYTRSDTKYSGRSTVPILWDKKQQTIVSNESAEIIRMFNSAFNKITGDEQDFYPVHLAKEIDALNDVIYKRVNNGVYKSGFARTQEAYNEAVIDLFNTLDQLEEHLSQSRYLLGDSITEADWRLLPTLARFDVAYFSAFKCNLRAIRDYLHLSAYFKDLYTQKGVAETVDFDVYRMGYHSQSSFRNPHGIVPIAFEPD